MFEYRYFVNGEIVPAGTASVSVRDRGFLYGDAAFETLRSYDGRPFHWEAHIGRLEHTCNRLGIDHGLDQATVNDAVIETLEANELSDAYIRLSITRGIQPGKLTPEPTTEPGLVIIVDSLPPGGSGGPAVWDRPATVIVPKTRRVPSTAIPADLKTHNFLNGILARLECRESGADEAVLLTSDGIVTEGATSNVFFVRENVLHTPTTSLPILPGITRDIVMSLAESKGIRVETGQYAQSEIERAEEIFLTNSTWEIRPVQSFGGVDISVGPVTRTLTRAFDEYVDRWIADDGMIDIDRWVDGESDTHWQ